jgi:hypothetical protein
VVGWRRGWRVILTWQSGAFSPTGRQEQVIDVDTVARLRQVLAAALTDPRVRTYRYRSVREWVDDGQVVRCRRGHELPPARYGVEDCCCGGGHLRSSCMCGDVRYVPERGPGCASVPHDPEAGSHYW